MIAGKYQNARTFGNGDNTGWGKALSGLSQDVSSSVLSPFGKH